MVTEWLPQYSPPMDSSNAADTSFLSALQHYPVMSESQLGSQTRWLMAYTVARVSLGKKPGTTWALGPRAGPWD